MNTEPEVITAAEVGNLEVGAQALTVQQRASRALQTKDHEPRLIELAAKHKDIVAIATKAEYDACHAARMELKRVRIDIDKTAEQARKDANAFSKAIIVEGERLVGIIQPEEDRLNKLQEAWDAKVAADKKAAAEAEERRIEDLRARVQSIRGFGFDCSHLPPDQLEQRIKDLVALDIGDDFQEQQAHANLAKEETLTRLRDMHTRAQERERADAERKAAQEAEARRLADERADLERQRTEQAERDRVESERLAAERRQFEAEQAAAREKQVAADLAAAEERERLAVEQRRLEAEREELAERERQRAETERREQLRKEAEAAEEKRKQEAAEQERVRRERELEENRRAEQARKDRQAEIDSATLRDAALEAHVLLQEIAPSHIATAKLGAALSREVAPLPTAKPARVRRAAADQSSAAA